MLSSKISVRSAVHNHHCSPKSSATIGRKWLRLNLQLLYFRNMAFPRQHTKLCLHASTRYDNFTYTDYFPQYRRFASARQTALHRREQSKSLTRHYSSPAFEKEWKPVANRKNLSFSRPESKIKTCSPIFSKPRVVPTWKHHSTVACNSSQQSVFLTSTIEKTQVRRTEIAYHKSRNAWRYLC